MIRRKNPGNPLIMKIVVQKRGEAPFCIFPRRGKSREVDGILFLAPSGGKVAVRPERGHRDTVVEETRFY